MNVFVSETCYRQVFGGKKGTSAKRIDDFNRLVARLQQAQSRADLQVKGLGTKKYHALSHDVYGVDLNNSLTAERVIFVFVGPDDVAAPDSFERYGTAGQSETVLLWYCSEHDEQQRNAQQVGRRSAAGEDITVVAALPDAQAAEMERLERHEVPWRTYGPGDLERYGRPRTPVLTQNKFRIVSDFMGRDSSMLVTGAAGSGKTELGLRVLTDHVRAHPGISALYLTASAHLLAEVETRCPDDVRPSCSFLSLETLLRMLAHDARLHFAGSAVFETFAATLRGRPAWGGAHHAQMIRLLDERGTGCIYAEIYGVIGGSMGAAWDRLDRAGGPAVRPAPLLAEEEYLALPDERCGLTSADERRQAYRLAETYARWAREAGYISPNTVALEQAAVCTRPRYDLVVADEVQDLTEVQIELLMRLCAQDPGASPAERTAHLFMCGDVNQVLTPTAFDARHLMQADRHLRLERLDGNFRNPAAVCTLANAVGALRAASPRLPARRGVEDAPEVCLNRTAGHTWWWIGDDEEALVRLADEGANVALLCDEDTYGRLRQRSSNVFTVEQIKGMEFENVILYGVLAASEARFDELFEPGAKDASLHRVLNRLYVGVTRSCGALLVAEPRSTAALEQLVARDEHFEHIADLGSVDFDVDTSARGYLATGRALKEQGAYVQACAHLERALRQQGCDDGLTPSEADDAERLLRACRIFGAHDPAVTPDADLAALFEAAGLYEEALPYARAALDVRSEALLTLAADRRLDGARFTPSARHAAFEHILLQNGLEIADLYGTSPRYDELLDGYLRERTEDMELFALETAEHISHTLEQLRTIGRTLHPNSPCRERISR